MGTMGRLDKLKCFFKVVFSSEFDFFPLVFFKIPQATPGTSASLLYFKIACFTRLQLNLCAKHLL